MADKVVPGDVKDAIAEALDRQVTEPKLAELAYHFFELAGGERAVAQLLLDEYRKPTTSPMVRSRILDLVLSATRFANQQGLGALDDLGNLTDRDLDRLLTEHLSRAMDRRGVQPDVSPHPSGG